MKSVLFLILGMSFLGITDCRDKNNNDYMSVGKITGPDYRMCACCGGWYIQIDSTMYEFDSVPASSAFSLDKATFPIFVNLDWQLADKPACPEKRILIKRIEKLNLK